jgi:hypothetical protein
MPKNSENNFADYFNLPNPGLRSYFDIVRKGQPDEYRTTFARGKSVQKVLQEWMPTLDVLSDKWPTLVEFEKDLAKKVGPMSIMKPLDQRMDDIEAYYTLSAKQSESISDSAVKAVIAEYAKVGPLALRGQKSTVDLMKKSTNSGSPYFTKRRTVVDKSTPCKIFSYPTRQDLPTGSWLACAVLGWRGQEGGPKRSDVKQRVVWMFPFAVNIAELQFYQPFIERVQQLGIEPAWISMDAVDRRITKMFDTKAAKDLVVCTDFSKFDQHFNPSLQDAAKQIITSILNSSEGSRNWLSQVFPVKYSIPLAYDYGAIRTGSHGMGSGSGGTNADETLAHRALQYEAAMSAKQRLNPNSQCLGDDGILTYPGITVEDVIRSYTRHGLDMNPDKQYVSTQDCTYLRRWHHVNYRVDGVCVGVYSTCRALGRLMEQERYYDPESWGPKMVALRQLSIIENVKYHPLREQFVAFCMKRDKYRLGIDIPGFLDDIDQVAREATEDMPDFIGYTKSMMPGEATGLSNWWIVKYLKSIS